jgi:enterochelin esterase-like enzyme
MKSIIYIVSLLCIGVQGLNAQQRAPRPVSPEVHSDNSVTFRYYAPQAKSVTLSTEIVEGKLEMVKDETGVWSIKIPAVTPDIYPYSFSEDGVEVADPNNTHIFANERFKRSIVTIPGENNLVHSLRNVPHGKVQYRYYKSGTLGVTREVLVYTPPGFDPSGKTKYPVLYLIHGGSDTQETWTKVGKANLIADNLIADGKAKPMIIVMPYGNVRPASMAEFPNDVIKDVIPFIESNYPVDNDSKNRAVAGFSVGGGQTLNVGLMNPDKFAYVASYAPYTATAEYRNNFGNWSPDAIKLNEQLKLFSISVGTEDFLYESVKENIAFFKGKNIKLDTLIVPGGHTWMNCKLFLADTLPKLFK